MGVYHRPSDFVIGYTAGILDGEGSIRGVTDKSFVQIIILQSEANNGERLVRWLADQWGMGRIYFRVKTTNLGIEGRMWLWQIGARRDALFLLEQLLPYLIVKKEKALSIIGIIKEHIDDQQRWTAYTKSEDDALRSLYARLPIDEVAAQLKRTPDSIRKRAQSIGLVRSGGRGWRTENPVTGDWTEEDDRYIKEHYGKILARDIAAHLGRTTGGVMQRASRLGITRSRGQRIRKTEK